MKGAAPTLIDADIVYDRHYVRNWRKEPLDYRLQHNLRSMMDRAATREDYEFAADCRDALNEARPLIAAEKERRGLLPRRA